MWQSMSVTQNRLKKYSLITRTKSRKQIDNQELFTSARLQEKDRNSSSARSLRSVERGGLDTSQMRVDSPKIQYFTITFIQHHFKYLAYERSYE